MRFNIGYYSLLCSRRYSTQRILQTIRKTFTDENKTREFGSKIAELCYKGDVISLVGEMGSGKTVFCQGFIRKICSDRLLQVTSPTYLLDNLYESNGVNVHHIDLYRLSGGQHDIARLGLFDPNDIYVIEWGDKLEHNIPPKQFLKITFEYSFESDEPTQSVRNVTLETSDEEWIKRLK
ncbi:tRNA threonylcarbamoyladenosine biosynthesis protein TsaE [Acrasis kona]|uniref:tRNA threonylcarbamoyladenosine biosynthesis protein TsaE n=1 Tax=Acrasis kona TaxID=1008807 RepID=A0AAW2ZS27_9EUKA